MPVLSFIKYAKLFSKHIVKYRNQAKGPDYDILQMFVNNIT